MDYAAVQLRDGSQQRRLHATELLRRAIAISETKQLYGPLNACRKIALRHGLDLARSAAEPLLHTSSERREAPGL
jgi:hypothetical protein